MLAAIDALAALHVPAQIVLGLTVALTLASDVRAWLRPRKPRARGDVVRPA